MAKHQKPSHQRFITYVIWLFGGILALGTVLDTISNALSLITKPVAIMGTLIVLFVWTTTTFYLRRHPLSWVTKDNKRVRIKSLGLRYSLPLLGMVLLVWFPIAWDVAQELMAPLEFGRERDGEILIVIATFYRAEGIADAETHNEIQRAIKTAISELNLSNVRVEVEPTVLRAEDRGSAEVLGARYDASMIIWGMETAVRVTVNFLNLKEIELDTYRELQDGIEISLEKPEAYVKFITSDLPGQLTFLTIFAISHSYLSQKDFEQAKILLERAISELPKDVRPPEGTAYAYFNLGSLQDLTESSLQKALQAYDQALLLKPDLIPAYHNRGFVRMLMGDLQGALTDYNQIVSLDPDNYDVYLARGAVRSKLGDYDGALADLHLVIQFSPESKAIAGAYLNRAGVRAAQGDFEDAIADYTKAVNLDAQFADLIYFQRGNAKLRANDLEGAIADFDLVLKLSPRFVAAYVDRGVTKAEGGDYMGAMLDLEHALRLDPENAKAYATRANIKQNQGDLEGAIRDYSQALNFEPDNADYLNNRGVARFYSGDSDGAIADYNLALTIEDDDAKIYNNRANARADKGDVTGAVEDYNQALVLDTNYTRAYFNRGMTFYKQGRLSDAVTDFNQVLTRDPDFADAYWGRGMAYRDMGNSEGALADFRRYLEINPNSDKRDMFEEWITELEAILERR